jgi:hypothetical protein
MANERAGKWTGFMQQPFGQTAQLASVTLALGDLCDLVHLSGPIEQARTGDLCDLVHLRPAA